MFPLTTDEGTSTTSKSKTKEEESKTKEEETTTASTEAEDAVQQEILLQVFDEKRKH